MSAFTDMFGQLLRRQQASGGEFRLGAGVVGHTTRVALLAVVVIGALALILERNTAVAINAIIAVAAVAAFYLHGTWKFADKHPDAAALAGTSWPKAEPKPQAAPAPKVEPVQPAKVEPAPAAAEELPPHPPQSNGDALGLPTQH
jgi:hypothetical protein